MAPLRDSNCREDLPVGGHVNDEFPCMNSTTKEEDQEGCRYPQREHRGLHDFVAIILISNVDMTST